MKTLSLFAIPAFTFVVGFVLMILGRNDVIDSRPWSYLGLALAIGSALAALAVGVLNAKRASE